MAEASVPAAGVPGPKPRVRVKAGSRVSNHLLSNAPVLAPYELASGKRSLPTFANVGPSDTAKYQALLRRGARHVFRTDAMIRRGVRVLVTNVIGNGPRLSTPFPELNDLVHAWFAQADNMNVLPFGQLLAAAYRSEIIDGEVLWRLRDREESDNLVVPLQVQLLEPDHCPIELSRDEGNGRRVNCGIEFGAPGDVRTAYYLTPVHPLDRAALQARSLSNASNEAVPVPADQVLQQFVPPRLNAPRGESKMMPAVMRSVNTQAFIASVETQNLVSSLYSVFWRRKSSETGPVGDQSELGEEWDDIPFEPGVVAQLPDDVDVTVTDPPDTTSNFQPYMRFTAEYLAACFDIAPEQLTGNWVNASDRTWKAGQITLRQLAEDERRRLEHQVLNPVIRAVVRKLVMSGKWVGPKGFAVTDSTEFNWAWPGHRNPNQNQDYAAAALAAKSGLTDRDTEMEELGFDPTDTDIRNCVAALRAHLLGVTYDGPAFDPAAPLAARLLPLVQRQVERAIERIEQGELDRSRGTP